MNENTYNVLTINGGSSSIKFSLYQCGIPMQQKLTGMIERIGLSGTRLTFNDTLSGQQRSFRIEASDPGSAADFLIDWLAQQFDITQISGVGHRVAAEPAENNSHG